MSESEIPKVTTHNLLQFFAVGVIIDLFLLSVVVFFCYGWI